MNRTKHPTTKHYAMFHNIPTERINSTSERNLLIEALREAPTVRLYEVGKALGVYQ